ncbi:response regulator [Spirosoma soli]
MIEANTDPRTKVLIVDDHRMFNDGLKAMLINEPTIEVVGQVYQSKDAPHALLRLSPDMLLMDFNMPGINGLEMTRQLLSSFPQLKVLILSSYAEQRYVDDFQKAGAKGYLLKTTDVGELIIAIKAIMAGKTYFDQKFVREVDIEPQINDDFLKKIKLTARELEVINYVRQGLTNQQIADAMHVSFYTVETHRKNIYFKLGVKSTAELLRFMDENK